MKNVFAKNNIESLIFNHKKQTLWSKLIVLIYRGMIELYILHPKLSSIRIKNFYRQLDVFAFYVDLKTTLQIFLIQLIQALRNLL